MNTTGRNSNSKAIASKPKVNSVGSKRKPANMVVLDSDADSSNSEPAISSPKKKPRSVSSAKTASSGAQRVKPGQPSSGKVGSSSAQKKSRGAARDSGEDSDASEMLFDLPCRPLRPETSALPSRFVCPLAAVVVVVGVALLIVTDAVDSDTDVDGDTNAAPPAGC